MTLKQAINILEKHNKWRRGATVKMIRPKILGEAIDVVVGSYYTIIQFTNLKDFSSINYGDDCIGLNSEELDKIIFNETS